MPVEPPDVALVGATFAPWPGSRKTTVRCLTASADAQDRIGVTEATVSGILAIAGGTTAMDPAAQQAAANVSSPTRDRFTTSPPLATATRSRHGCTARYRPSRGGVSKPAPPRRPL